MNTQRSISKSNYYKLLDDLAALGRLRRLRLEREAAQVKDNQSIGSKEKKGNEEK